MSEVALISVPGGKKLKGVRTSAVQEIRLQNYLSGESFSPVPVKYEHSIYINPTPPYRNAMDIVKYNIIEYLC
jgi:hypothetical protein